MRYLIYILLFTATATFGQDTLTQTLLGDTIGTVLVNCASDYDTELFRLQGDLRKAADYGDSATAAYSLRYVTDSYDSVVVRVRRSSDNAELDFAPENIGDSLVSWVNTDVAKYTSDFTSGNENLNEVGGVGTDGESIAGVNDAYRFELSGGNTLHQILRTQFDESQEYRVQLDYYLPSTNALLNNLIIGSVGGDSDNDNSITDSWTTFDDTLSFGPTGVFFIRTANGNNTAYDSDGDSVFLKNIVITQLTADGHVTTWYDQMNGNHATQATASSQPKIVSGGALVTENGKAAIDFDGVSTSLIEGNGATNIQNVSLFSVTKPNNTNDDACVIAYSIIGNNSGVSFGQGGIGSSQVWGSRYRNTGTDISTSGIALTTSQSLISSISINLTSTQIYANAIAGGLSSSSRLNFNYTEIGGGGNGNFIWDGNIQEIIIYESDQSSNRGNIESEINSYYNIASTIPGLTDTRIIRQSDSLKLVIGQADTTFIGLPTAEDRIGLTWESDTIRVSLNGQDAVSKGVNYTQDYTEWFFSTQSPVTYYELIRWAIRLTNNELETLTK